MKTFYLSGIAILVCLQLSAQVTQGPFEPIKVVSGALPGNNLVWKNQANASGSDDVYAFFDVSSGNTGDYTDYLMATDFGFNIPLAATINGIVVNVERSDANQVTTDYSVRLIKNDIIVGAEFSNEVAYPATDGWIAYGNSTELWGDTWTPAEINDPHFGIGLAATILAGGSGDGGSIDDITISVTYTLFTLPIKLTAFSGSPKNDLVHLLWTTSDESRMDHFDIQRSTNGTDFNTIGSINCTNRNFMTSYSFDDVDPVKGVAWYRLKMIGTSAEVNYSKIISIKYGSESSLSLYPTLWSPGSPLSINNASNEKLRIEFFNNTGQVTGVVTTSSMTVPTEALTKQTGLLFYKIISENGQLQGTGRLQVH